MKLNNSLITEEEKRPHLTESDRALSSSSGRKSNHQVKALLCKTASLQWKQPCTNVCQIITPIICLLFTILIRNVALDNLPTNQANVYNQIPLILFKFNDYQLQNEFQGIIFGFGCNRWMLYDWAEGLNEDGFIGQRDGNTMNQTGLLRHIPRTNQFDCYVNESFYEPYASVRKVDIPYFRNPRLSIDEELYWRFLYFNDVEIGVIRHGSVVEKMPDAGVYFRKASRQGLDIDLKINDLRQLELHPTNGITKISVRNPLVENSSYAGYITVAEGYLSLQDMFAQAYVKELTGETVVSGYLYMPLLGDSSAFIETIINITATIIFPLSLSLLLPVFLYNLVLEKESRVIQMMRMNGLSMRTYWAVNFLFNFLVSLATYTVFFLFGYFVLADSLFRQTSFWVLATVLLGWVLCQIAMSMLLQAFISNSRAANIIGYLLTIWTNLVGATLSVALYQYPVPMPLLVSLWPTISFNRLFYLMFINCSADHCFNSFSSLTPEMWTCIAIIYGAAIVFALLGMYLFEVIPQEFGVTKNLLFPLECLFKKHRLEFTTGEEERQWLQDQSGLRDECDHLALQQNKKVATNKFQDYALICSKLTKEYDNGKLATNEFSLILEDNQVFGLLGPNGAGKTTLISMITGIFAPSKGKGYVSGYSIETEMDSVHMNMGVCPQFDILWNELTVEEHLFFYARLRGTPGREEKRKVADTLQEVNLQQFANFKVKELSGGMKRRLSVAISLVGDPRVVFLDEPTTGLDPENRRNLWELLSKCKDRRSLFLTTHLMEEAESLCDKIGIITNGRLRTVGDQSELKKLYGNGYVLTISVEVQRGLLLGAQKQNLEEQMNRSLSESELSRSNSVGSLNFSEYEAQRERSAQVMVDRDSTIEALTSRQKLQILKQKVLSTIPNSSLRKEMHGTLKFLLGSVKISKVLQDLEHMKKELSQIEFEWAISNSNLEDVFLNVVNTYPKNQSAKEHLREDFMARQEHLAAQRTYSNSDRTKFNEEGGEQK